MEGKMGMLKARMARAVTLCWLPGAYRLVTARTVFVVNCTLLLLNVLFFLLNRCPEPSTVEAHYLTPFDPDQSALIDLTFKTFAEAMDLNNLTYFVFAGSLLGSWRHHGRIPWDDDIDVMINASERQTVNRVLRSKSFVDTASFGVYDAEKGDPGTMFQWKFYPLKGQTGCGKAFRAPFVDIFFYLENETHIWNANRFPANEIWLKSQVFPLRRRPFGKLMVPAPCNPVVMLERYFNASMCQPRRYNHSNCQFMHDKVEVPCSRLSQLYPFVHRAEVSRNDSTLIVLETLKLGDFALQQFDARICS